MDLETILIDEEGSKRYAYHCTEGYLTIGVGRNIDPRGGRGLDSFERIYLLGNDLKQVRNDLVAQIPWYQNLSEPRRAVLEEMAFQMGVPGLLKFVNTLELVKDGNFNAAADGMLASLWARQTPERAARKAKQMKENRWILRETK
jgi:lysozyme